MHWSSWPQNRRTDDVDKKGLAVALAFLVAVMLLAGGRGDGASEDARRLDASREATAVDHRQASKAAFDVDDDSSTQQRPDRASGPLRP
jgi:hypothetical protein